MRIRQRFPWYLAVVRSGPRAIALVLVAWPLLSAAVALQSYMPRSPTAGLLLLVAVVAFEAALLTIVNRMFRVVP
jgi:hypothetical protein